MYKLSINSMYQYIKTRHGCQFILTKGSEILAKTYKSILEYQTRFWNNLHQVFSKSKDWNAKWSFWV